MKKDTKIYIAGHKGMVGSAVWRALKQKGYTNLLGKTRSELDLRNQQAVTNFYTTEKPEVVIDSAAKVGGILANNDYPYPFLMENMQIQNNLIDGAFKSGVEKFIFLGSSCIYPKLASQPLKEKYLLTGELESTNDAYAIAKIAGIKMCQSYNSQYKTNYRSLMPTNTFGPNDNYDDLNSHFLPALIKKIHRLKNSKNDKLLLWGNGKAKRELIYVDDLANACVYFMNKKTSHNLINIGTGKDYSIRYYAELIANIILPNRKIFIKYDTTKPNGTAKKVMDVSIAKKYGWHYKISLEEAILNTYQSYLKEIK